MDEADKLLNMDFEKDINQILDILPKKTDTICILCQNKCISTFET